MIDPQRGFPYIIAPLFNAARYARFSGGDSLSSWKSFMKNHAHLFISIIIPVYNDAKRLDACLAALQSQTYPKTNFEVIIVDNGSKDNIEDITENYDVHLIKEKQPGSYRARNCGIMHSKGEVIGFTDSDCIPCIDWISNASRYFNKNSTSSILSGKINVIKDHTIKNSAFFLYDQIYHFNQVKFSKNNNFAATANLFCKRKVFEHVGFFNENFYSFGDVEFGRRAKVKGFKIEYDEQVEVNHPQIKSYKALWQRSKRLAGGGRQLRIHKGSNDLLELLYLLLLITGTPFIILCRFFYPDIASWKNRVLFAWASLIVHLSKCIELYRLFADKKECERK